MKTLKTKYWAILFMILGALEISKGQDLWQWDFNQGDLSATLGGEPLQYADGASGATAAGTVFSSTASLKLPTIDGTNANVMEFPISGPNMGYLIPTPVDANGGSPDLVNDYTLIVDVLFPTNSVDRVRPILQTDDGLITPDADLVIDSSGGIGAPPGPYGGSIQPNVWYRIAFSVTATEIDEYINGVKVGVQQTGGTDSRFALSPGSFAQLFQNSTTNSAASGYVSSIQLQDVALNAGQVAALGSPTASKIPTNTLPVLSYIESQNPTPNETDVTPFPMFLAVLNAGGAVVDPNSISLSLDGEALNTLVVDTGTNFQVTATNSIPMPPLSTHTITLNYSDSISGTQQKSWSFSVCQYQNVTLPAPIYLETFDEVAEGSIPDGWTVTNNTTTLTPGINLFDTQSDSYKNWVTISVDDYTNVYPEPADYTSPGFPEIAGNERLMIPPIVENGVLLNSLASTNLMVAESDQRDGNQVQVMFTKDYNFTSYSNVYLSFHNIYEQNQDNTGAVEYSIDQGVTWQPLLYLLDDGTTDGSIFNPANSDVVHNPVTGAVDAIATFTTARSDQAYGLAYGTFIGAAITTNLAPYIRGCRQDDPVQQKRIELLRLPLADNQPNVRLRFMQAGTGSWYFDIDDVGFYSIPQALIVQPPTAINADYNGPATFTVTGSGDNLTYQWKFNGTNILDATNSSYVIANTATNDVGLYSVGVSNSYGGVLSAQVPLTLVYTPVVLAAPQDQTITVGETAEFSITARGGQPLSYQWLFNSNAIPGATGTNYIVTDAQATNSGHFQVVVSNSFSSVVSPGAKLTVFAGSITQDMVVHLTFDNTYADASGSGNYGSAVGTPTFEPGFLGEAVHVTSSGAPANNPATNNYVTLGYPADLEFGSDLDPNGATDFSVSFWVKIFSQNDDKPFIANKDWDSGGNPGWDINSEGGGMKWNYEDDAINEPGVGSSRRDSSTVAPELEDGGWHHVVVTMARHSVGRIYVDGTLRDESPLGTDSLTNIVGSADTESLGWHINIGQDGTGTYTDNTGGAAIDMLVDDLAIWRRVITDEEALGVFNAGLHSNMVDQATITTPGAGPMITLQPTDTGAGEGASAKFVVSALGSPELSYQWYFGDSVLTDATNSQLTVTNIQSSSQGNYSVVITNDYGSVTSRLATLSYTGILPPTVTVQPMSEFVAPGTPVTFSVAASGLGTLSYQWYRNGAAINGATATNLVITNAETTNASAYYVAIDNGTSSTNSVTALLDVFTGTLNSGLVAYLPFDGDYKDYSGNNNNGTPVGSPSFSSGRVGQALHFATTNDDSVLNYVTLGYPSDLQFGTNSFSVGFWVNYTNQNDDPAFIANKNWSSSGNQGWGIFSQSGGNFRVNAMGTSGTKMDTTGTPIVRDGNWHFIVSTYWRGQYTSVYVDGNLVLTSPLTFGGSVDTVTNGYSVNIGQDGTGMYTDNHDSSLHIDGLIDEVMLWNRVVTAPEVAALYNDGTNNVTPLIYMQNQTISGKALTLSWKGGVAPFTIESITNLASTNWMPYGTTSLQATNINVTNGPVFFRVRGALQAQ